VYASAELVALVPPGVVTVTSIAPTAPAGLVAVMLVALITVTLVAATPPKLTPVAPVKFVPVIVTLVPPAAGPLAGLTEVTVGVDAMPVPLRAMLCVVELAVLKLSVITKEPALVPTAVGLKSTA